MLNGVDCLTWCRLNKGRVTLEMLADKHNGDTTVKTLSAKSQDINYRLEYAPMGNDVQNPAVIICGLAPGNQTWRLFLNAIRNGVSTRQATRQYLYSNLRENLFRCLDALGLFDYLAKDYDYWRASSFEKGGKRTLWYQIFEDNEASRKCGMQLTQACHCAILRNKNSTQPSKAALDEICHEEPACLFNSFQCGTSLRLVIFLGTSCNLEGYWKNSRHHNPGVQAFSIPHPSGQNRVFNNGDLFKPENETDNAQLRNAKTRMKKGRDIIQTLRARRLER